MFATINNQVVNKIVNAAYMTLDEIDQEIARDYLNDLDKLEHLLKALNASHEQMAAYAVLEARAYLKIAELPIPDDISDTEWDSLSEEEYNSLCDKVEWYNQLPKQTAGIVRWIKYDLDDSYRNQLIPLAEIGKPINCIYEAWRREKSAIKRQCAGMQYRDEQIKKYETDGVVTISSDECQRKIGSASCKSQALANTIVNQLRSDLIKRDGVCVGDGTYININSNDFKRYAARAVLIRLRSVVADIASMCTIIKAAHGQFMGHSFDYLREECFISSDIDASYLRQVIQLLKNVGLVTYERYKGKDFYNFGVEEVNQ